MSISLLRRIRVLAASIAVAVAVSLVFIPAPLPSQEVELCMFDDGSHEWDCVEEPHRFQGDCEGVDCYTQMEICCVLQT